MSQRVNVRIRTDSAAVIAYVTGTPPAPARNLSLGGVFLVTGHRWPLGGTETLTIEYGGRKLQTQARVTHIQPNGVGFSFASASERFLCAVRDIIDALLAGDGAVGQAVADRKRVSDPVVWSQAGASHSCVLRNLSHGGALVACDSPPATGSEIFVYLPGYTYSAGTQKPTELRGCRAEVVRVADGCFACKFVEPSAEFLMGIAQRLAAG